MSVAAAAPTRADGGPLLRVRLFVMMALQIAVWGSWAPKLFPYMTLLGYFNSLRELGGSRRIVEDEVNAGAEEMVDHGRRCLHEVKE